MTIRRKVVFVLFLVLTLAWMGVVFGFSSQNAEESTQQSNAVTEILLKIFVEDFNSLDEQQQQQLIEDCDGFVRKTAHFTAYAILGLLLYFAVGAPKYLTDRILIPMAFSIPVGVVFAITDEYHQAFVDGRAGQISDVVIDSSGVLFGTLIALIVAIIIQKRTDKIKKEA